MIIKPIFQSKNQQTQTPVASGSGSRPSVIKPIYGANSTYQYVPPKPKAAVKGTSISGSVQINPKSKNIFDKVVNETNKAITKIGGMTLSLVNPKKVEVIKAPKPITEAPPKAQPSNQPTGPVKIAPTQKKLTNPQLLAIKPDLSTAQHIDSAKTTVTPESLKKTQKALEKETRIVNTITGFAKGVVNDLNKGLHELSRGVVPNKNQLMPRVEYKSEADYQKALKISKEEVAGKLSTSSQINRLLAEAVLKPVETASFGIVKGDFQSKNKLESISSQVLAAAPLVAVPIKSLVKFMAVSMVFDKGFEMATGKQAVSQLLPKDTPQVVKTGVDLLELLGKAYIAHKINPGAIREAFTKSTIEKYGVPQNYNFTPREVQDVVIGKDQGVAKDILSKAKLSSSEWRDAVKKGIKIDIPAEKVIEMSDKPYWAKIKSLFGVSASEVKTAISKADPSAKAGFGGYLTSGEHTPKEVINSVFASGEETTAHGKQVIKTALQAEKQGQNILIETPSEAVNSAEVGKLKSHFRPAEADKEIQKQNETYLTDNLSKAKEDYSSRVTEKFGTPNVISADEAKYILPGFEAKQSGDYHSAASSFSKYIYDEKLQTQKGKGNNTVMFLSGGTGSGKTTAIKGADSELANYSIIYDTNLTGKSAATKIDKALKNGYDVEINYIQRNPVTAFTEGVIPRVKNEGRLVNIGEHVDRHIEAFKTLEDLKQKYGDKISVRYIDNTGGKGEAKIVSFDKLPKYNYTKEELTNILHGELKKAVNENKVTSEEAAAISTSGQRGSSSSDQPQSELTQGKSELTSKKVITNKNSKAVQSAMVAKLQELGGISNSPEEYSAKLDELVTSTLEKTTDKEVLSGLRTALNKEMFGIAGVDPNGFKKSYAELQMVKNEDPDTGALVAQMENYISIIDEKLISPAAPISTGSVEAFDSASLQDIRDPKADVAVDGIVKRSEIANRLSEILNVPIRQGKFRKPNASAIFKVGKDIIRTKVADIRVISHEVGHFFQHNLPEFQEGKLATYEKELTNVTDFTGYPNPSIGEKFADFVSLWTVAPENAQKYAPELYKYFEESMAKYPEMQNVMEATRQDSLRWDAQPAAAKILSQISFEDPKVSLGKKISNKLEDLYTTSKDDLYPLSRFVKMAKGQGVKLNPDEDPYLLARTFRGWTGKVDTFFTKGTFGKKFWKEENGKIVPNYTGKPLNEIMKKVEEDNALNDFRVYLVARRVAYDLVGRDQEIKTGISLKDAETAISEMEAKHDYFAETAKELYKFQDASLQYAKESGLLSKEGEAAIREANKNYVPFFRLLEDSAGKGFMGSKTFANISSPIKKIKGSELEIIDPMESIVKNTYALINAGDRNQVGIMLARMADKDKELGKLFEKVPVPMQKVATISYKDLNLDPSTLSAEVLDTIVNIFRPVSMPGKGNVITVAVDGKKEFYQVEDHLHRALLALDKEDLGLWVKIFSAPAKWLRAGATLAPEFAVRNPMRDQWNAYIFSNYGYMPVVDFARGMFSLFKKDDYYYLYKMSGAESASMVSLDRDYLKKTFEEVIKGKPKTDYVKNPLEILQIFSELGEQATRLGEARRGFKKGANPTEVAFSAREVTLDFARIGAKMKAVNALVAFFNARVEAIDRTYRGFKDHPFRTTSKVFFAITLPSILLYLANRDDPRYKEIPQWQKDLFWIVMTKDHIYRIPKPFELGIIFGTGPERALEYMDNKDPEVFNQLAQTAMDGINPGFIPTSLLPLIENMTNFSFFQGRPIVGERQKNLPDEAQYTSTTSELAKALGKWFQYSPAKIDNLFYGYSGGLGKYFTAAVDKVMKGTGLAVDITKPSPMDADVPVMKAFIVRNPIGSSSASVDKFYNHFDIAEKREQLLKQYITDGNKEEFYKYEAAHPESKLQYDSKQKSFYSPLARYYRNVAATLSDGRKLERQIMSSKKLSAQEKRDKITKIDTIITKVAQDSLNHPLK